MSDNGNTIGRLYAHVPIADVSMENANPPVVAETHEEAIWLASIHEILGGLGAVPEAGAVFDSTNALIYAIEGNAVQAGVSGAAAALDLIPGLGTAAKVAEFGIKGAAKRTAKDGAQQIAKREAGQEAKQAEKTVGRGTQEAGKPPAGNDGGKIKGGPCDHLKQGLGKGPYRGGAHSKASKPANDGKDSHHVPADDVSPLATKDGPAIQMDRDDHAMTSSNGQNGRAGKRYRKMIGDLLKDGKWREAMSMEIRDIRRIASELGNGRKYNEAIQEMLEYFKCLAKNGLLKMG